MTIREAMKELRLLAKHNGGLDSSCAFAVWTRDDIVFVEEVLNEKAQPPLTDEQRDNILSEMHDNQDATEGITFDTIQFMLSELQSNPPTRAQR